MYCRLYIVVSLFDIQRLFVSLDYRFNSIRHIVQLSLLLGIFAYRRYIECKIKVAIETVKWRPLLLKIVWVWLKSGERFHLRKKKISPRCFAYNPLLHLTWTREKTCWKNALFTLDARGKRFFRGFTPDLYIFLYCLYNYLTV